LYLLLFTSTAVWLACDSVSKMSSFCHCWCSGERTGQRVWSVVWWGISRWTQHSVSLRWKSLWIHLVVGVEFKSVTWMWFFPVVGKCTIRWRFLAESLEAHNVVPAFGSVDISQMLARRSQLLYRMVCLFISKLCLVPYCTVGWMWFVIPEYDMACNTNHWKISIWAK